VQKKFVFFWDGLLVETDDSIPFCIQNDYDKEYLPLVSIGEHTVTAHTLDAFNQIIGPNYSVTYVVSDTRRKHRKASSNDNNMNGLLKSSFDGASGVVEFEMKRNVLRNAGNIMVGLFNVHPKVPDAHVDLRSYSTVLLSQYTEQNGWKDIPGAVLVHRDGSTFTQDVPRRFFDFNYLSKGVRIVGLILLCFAWCLVFSLLVLVVWTRNDPVIKRSNPVNYAIICIGSAVMSVTIFMLSWDEYTGWTERQLNMACTLTPWFFFPGHMINISALFMMVLSGSSGKAAFSQWKLPVVCILVLFLSTMTALLIAQTILDPWTWQRIVIREVPAETYGQCTSNNAWAYFGPMVGLLFSMELLLMYFCWKKGDYSSSSSDTAAVMYNCFAHVQGWAVGGSILAVLGNSSVDATYFGRTILIWIFAASSLMGVVGTKVARALSIRRHPVFREKRQSTRVNISNVVTFSNEEFKIKY
jgi:hypothetical protein